MDRLKLSISLLFLYCAFPSLVEAQSYRHRYEAVPIVPQRVVLLDAAQKDTSRVSSRFTMAIEVPENTMALYYSFTSLPDDSAVPNQDLHQQIYNALQQNDSSYNIDLDKIHTPAGSFPVNFYLFDYQNSYAFSQLVDKQGGKFNYFIEESVLHSSQATKKTTETLNPQLFIGFENPDSFASAEVTFEIVAVVAQPQYMDSWTQKNLKTIYNNCLSFLENNPNADTICSCMQTKITESHTPDSYNQYSKSELRSIYKNYIGQCSLPFAQKP